MSYSVVMSIKVILQAPGLNLQASVKDEALGELIKITQEYRDQDAALGGGGSTAPTDVSASVTSAVIGDEEAVKARLGTYGAAELLNQMRWETYPEKILLLGAWHEARGGSTPWKSSDWTWYSDRRKKVLRAISRGTSKWQLSQAGYIRIRRERIPLRGLDGTGSLTRCRNWASYGRRNPSL